MKTKLTSLFLLIAAIGFSQGFYKSEKDPAGKFVKNNYPTDTNHFNVLHAINGVESKAWKLEKSKKNTYTYPNHGWYWADTKNKALDILKLMPINKNDTID